MKRPIQVVLINIKNFNVHNVLNNLLNHDIMIIQSVRCLHECTITFQQENEILLRPIKQAHVRITVRYVRLYFSLMRRIRHKK